MASLAWLWNPTKRLFQNIAKGITLTKAQLIKARDTFVTARAPTLAAITDRLIKGDISLTQWEGEMQQAIADQFTAQYLLGRGGTDAMTDADKAALAGAIAEQFGFLRTFTQDIAAGRLSAAQIGARAAMYGESSVQAHGMGQGAAWQIDLPCWPADGGTPCVASPDSRVMTYTGWRRIADVAIGDEVMTHRGRFRPVTAVIHSQAISKNFFTLRGSTGMPVTFTADHELVSPYGWLPVDGIIRSGLPMYTVMEQTDGARYLPDLWTHQRPPCAAVQMVCGTRTNAAAMGTTGNPSEDDDGDSGRRREAAHTVCGFERVLKLGQKDGWPILCPLLGRRPQASNLSLSMALDYRQWADPAGAPYPPSQRRPERRSARKPDLFVGIGARSTACAGTHDHGRAGAGSDAALWSNGDMRAMRRLISDQRTEEGESLLLAGVPDRFDADDTNLPALRTAIHRWIGSWQAPEILQQGMLRPGTTLYDLTVEGDHSFIVEGIVAHNCSARCRCSWDISDVGDAIEATWQTVGGNRVCDGCEERGAMYNPLVFPKALDGEAEA